MYDNVLELTNISKDFYNTEALKNVNLKLKKGKIYGFVGKNSSGKTTLMRVIAGLILPKDNGEIKLFGKYKKNELLQARRRMGSLIETPNLYGNISAKKNLEIHRIACGIPDNSIVEKTIKLFGIDEFKEYSVNTYSLGMKQRLGIALATLNTPELLLLDEPINGIDPINIVDIRKILIDINKKNNTTMLISSHILSELHELATDYIFIDEGEIIREISQDEINKNFKKHIVLTVDNITKATVVLEKELETNNFQVISDDTIRLFDYTDNIGKVSKALSSEDIAILKINLEGEKLEDYFKELINNRKGD